MHAGVPTPALVVDVAAARRNAQRAAARFQDREEVQLRPHFKAHKCTRLLELQLAAGGCVGVTCATAYEAEVVATRMPGVDVLVANQIVDPHALDAPRLRLRGLQGYEGHAVLLPDRARRAEAVAAAAGLLAVERDALRRHGLRCDVVSGGGTGTIDLAADAGVLTEIQAGSYVLMDASYAGLELPFERALTCATTVVSRSGDRVVLDAGLKALSAEYGVPQPAVPGTLEVLGLADEHATARVGTDSPLAVGDAVALVPAHVDPTVNLHPALYAVEEDGSIERWPVDGRRT